MESTTKSYGDGEPYGDIDLEPHLYCDCSLETPHQARFLSGTACVYTARSPNKSTSNEDCAAVIPFDKQSGALVVADGMGGHAAGEVASRCAVESLAGAIAAGRDAGLLLRSAIINGFETANEVVQQFANGAGTTLAVAEINGGQVRTYHSGDSIILVSGQRGKIKLSTTSHSPIGYGVEAGFLDPQAAMFHEDRHLILNAVGNAGMRIEIGSPIKLAFRDTVLLASDGLTDNLPESEIVQTIRKGDLLKSLGQLVTKCRDRMCSGTQQPSKPDDLTIIAFRLQ